MSEFAKPVDDAELQAYIDNQLDSGRRSAVERHLAADSEAAARVAAYQQQRRVIRAAFALDSAQPLPEQLSLASILARRKHGQPRMWLWAASVALSLGIGLAGGYLLHTATNPSASPEIYAASGQTMTALADLERQALASHVVYSADRRHPIEVSSAETPHLQQWLSNRLDRIVVAPDLSALGYHLIGGRLLATEQGGAAALLMYTNAEHQRISLLLRPMKQALHAQDTTIQQDGVNGRAWIGNGLGVAVVANVPPDDIARLASQISADLSASG